MTWVIAVCGVMLTVGVGFAIVRAEKGPSILDRTVALDIVVTTMIAAVALYAAIERRTDVVPVLVVLSLVGFVGSVTVARFASVEPEGEGRVRTREEVAAEDAARRAAEDEAERRRLAGEDDEQADAEPLDDGQADDEQADGEQADGEQADGEQADGEQADGEQADAEPLDAEPTDERPPDGAVGADTEEHGGGAEGEVR